MPPRILRKVRRATPPARAPGLVYPRPKELLLPRIPREITRAELKLLVEALRNQPGINVRLPSHHLPPIRSLPIDAVGIVDLNVLASANAVTFTCPARYAGVITGVGFSFPPGTGAGTWFGVAGNTVLLVVNNRIYLPTQENVAVGAVAGVAGFEGLKPEGIRRMGTAAAATSTGVSQAQGGLADTDLVACNVPIFGGQVAQIRVITVTVAGAQTIGAFRLRGWYYPQRADTGDNGILGTIVD